MRACKSVGMHMRGQTSAIPTMTMRRHAFPIMVAANVRRSAGLLDAEHMQQYEHIDLIFSNGYKSLKEDGSYE